ncbi:hypothetical protein I6F33_37555, partial [Bradyrhizobium sp. BRP20]|uniref:hypothetical protein n=1 Tax=Bradyrhizobium sp. BRP20 TaxID=2793822 RepID=UPI001CD36122
MVDAWAQAQDVLDITGEEVDDTVIAHAQSHIEMACGRLYEDTPRMGTRDLAWLKKAVAYQAAWLPHQPDWAQR